MSIQACAEAVRRGDADRFLSAMTAPPGARPLLFALYAFNLEVSRATVAAREPMIVQMRLQWWRDALAEIASGGIVRRHEVVAPLAQEIRAYGLSITPLLEVIDARERDLDAAPFEDDAALRAYLEATAGALAVAAGRGLGCGPAGENALRRAAGAAATGRWLAALGAMTALGGQALGPRSADRIPGIAEAALGDLRAARKLRFGASVPVLRAFWMAGPVLRQARREPVAALEGRLGLSEFRRRGSLLLKTAAGRW